MKKTLLLASLCALAFSTSGNAKAATSYGVSITEAATQPGNAQYVIHRPSVLNADFVNLATCNQEVSAVANLWQTELNAFGLINPSSTGGLCSSKAQATTNVTHGVLFVDFYVPQLGWQFSLTQSVTYASCASLLANNANLVLQSMGNNVPAPAGTYQTYPLGVSYTAFADGAAGTVFVGCTGF